MENQFVPKPNSNMFLAIFTTLCCCLPLGIIAIIKASKVDGLYAMQQYNEANLMAADAKKWSLIGIGIGVVCEILFLICDLITYGA